MVAAVSAWLLCLIVIAFYWKQLPPQIPFLYSLPKGDAWLINKEWLAGVLGGFAFLLLANIILAKTWAKSEKLQRNYLIWGAATVEFMLLVNILKIITLII